MKYKLGVNMEFEKQVGQFFIQQKEPNELLIDNGALTIIVKETDEGIIVDVVPADPTGFENDELILGTLGVMNQEGKGRE